MCFMRWVFMDGRYIHEGVLYLILFTVLEVGDGVFEVLSTSGDTHLGGDDFDKVTGSSMPNYILVDFWSCI